jgi:hypothetical protein
LLTRIVAVFVLSPSPVGTGPSFDLPLADAQIVHESNVKHAEALFAKNQALLRQSKDAAAKTLSDEELARRKDFLLKQREILLRKKKAEREGQLEKFEAEKTELEGAAGPAKLTEQEEMERKKAALKGALVQHLKTVHSEVEMKRAQSLDQKEQATLAQQFQKMEQMRLKKQAAISGEQQMRQQQELERKKTMQRLAENMAQNRLDD